jgi:hypothetical protein
METNMRVRLIRAALISMTILIGVASVVPATAASPALILSCTPENDMYRVLQENRVACVRHDTLAQAVDEAPQGAAVMILADQYPAKTTAVPPGLFDRAKAKNLRLYIEYPSMLPGLKAGEPRTHKRGPYGSNRP